MVEKLVQAAANETRRAERKRRHRIDDLRYALKKVHRHIDVDMTYEEVSPSWVNADLRPNRTWRSCKSTRT